ncbi:MAG: T9SS C-terminal target domain-containing protein [Bacteroidetes bacterium]|nr:T9SS C-terminal target domain-containing protein [Bacteroidota bacterium]
MKNIKTLLLLLVLLTLTTLCTIARENIDQPHFKKALVESVMSGCIPAKTQTELDINNVRTTILTGGDMWWNLLSAKYEIPKGGGAHSLFSGSLWIGGIDAGAQLKVAAMTYRQNGNDFWPGPLDTTTVDISAADCAAFDKHFTITRKEVEDFVNGGPITQNIINWPGNGNTSIGQGKYLAPFYDKDGNGIYDPAAGDYPKYSMDSRKFACDDRQVFGDKTLWWVFNDKGNIHTESDGNSIGLEVRAQAFAFTSTDEINNMTFYDYEVINRSSIQLNKTYFGVWVDADLGYAFDDYVGCDVQNGIGYCYNGNPVDGSGALGTYGANPPAVGVDFFRGPKAAEPGDGIDSLVSYVEPNGRISMAKFVYYNNDFTVQGNPTKQTDYYNYLSGKWIDGTPFTYGGNAKGGSTVCAFMFPGDTDPSGKGTQNVPQSAWTETTVGNPVGDRRFLQSAGPFTLKPGAVNNVTIGCVWARATQGGPLASVSLMRDADVKAQALFNSCFKITNGPDAPDLTIQELDKQLIVYLTNKATSNNYKEGYKERDPFISSLPDSLYGFEGYQVYQIVDSTVTVTDLNNPDKARLIFQTDRKNGVAQIVNYYKDQSLGGAWVPQQMVYGADAGVSRSFTVDKDLFAKGDNKLVNHKQYFFTAVAYGYNVGEASADPINRPDGYNLPYISGRRNINNYVAIPHNIAPEAGGTEQHSNYGDGVQLTRIEGQGNGGHILDITSKSVTDILSSTISRAINITYERGKGPVEIKVVDPLNVPPGCFTIAISDSTPNARWTLKNSTTGSIIAQSDTSLLLGSEQIIPELGISIRATYTYDVGYGNAPGNSGILEATISFADPLKNWLSALADVDGTTAPYGNLNWIRSGKTSSTPASPYDDYFSGTNPVDGSQDFEKLLSGTWAPYRLCAYSDAALTCTGGPAWDKLISQNDIRKTLASVDIVLTSDKTKWTRCPVIEMAEETAFAEGGARKMDLRNSPSIDQNGNKGDGTTWSTNPADPGYIAPTGMGWFPGYAINVETGERLNMAYGEDSGLPLENGRDMVWNPTSNVFSSSGANPIFGGKHYIYVFAHSADLTPFSSGDAVLPNGAKSLPPYDRGKAIWELLNTVKVTTSNNNYKRVVYVDAMWVNIPLLSSGHQLLESDVKVRLRVSRKFRKGFSGFYGITAASQAVIDTITPSQNLNYPMYSFCTNDLEAHKGDHEIAKNAIDLINVVPNPYYAFSGYETDQADNRIKITNLPEKCTVRMYSLNGTLIRTFKKDDPKTSLDWDLKNQANIPIASGMYIIHVDAPGVGEKILKWFGVMRPVDLDSY